MYNWEMENSKSNSKHKKHSHFQFDSRNPTCTSSFLNKFNHSLKPHYPKSHKNEDFCFNSSSTSTTPRNRVSPSSTTTPKNRASSTTEIPKDEKMSSLRRACLVEKWMEKKVNDKVIAKTERNSSSSSTTLLEEFDLQDALFFSSTTTTSSSSSSEIEYSVFTQPKQKPKVTCFAPPKPKPIKTRTIESAFIDHFGEENDEEFMKNRSKAANFYSNLKNFKQPISPGVRLTSFINSLFTKDGKSKKKKSSNFTKQSKTEESVVNSNYSSCSSASSFSRSCMSNINNNKFRDNGVKRTVRFCPVSVIVDDESQACGYKSLREEKAKKNDEENNNLMNSKFGRSLSKKYEELKKLNGLERENDRLQQQRKIEEVALDLLSGYWDSRLNKSHDLSGNYNKVSANDGNYGVNHGVNYVQHEEEEDDEDDGFSCSSSDLFELDHLALIGDDELPVYETTKI